MKVINSTPLTIKVNGNTLFSKQTLDITLKEGDTVFISSEKGVATVKVSSAQLAESSMGELEVNTVSTTMVIVDLKR